MRSKLDRRKKYTRMVLKESFIKCMQKKPLSRITIKEVCEFADINRSTFYTHYTDLYDLLCQIEDAIIEDLNQTLSSYNNSKNEEAIEMIEKILEYLAENRESCQTLFGEHGALSFQKKVMMLANHHMINTLKTDRHNITYNLEYLSLYIINGSIHVIQHWLKNGLDQSTQEMAEMITKLAYEGLSTFLISDSIFDETH